MLCFALCALAGPWLFAQPLPPAPGRPERTNPAEIGWTSGTGGAAAPTNGPLPVEQDHMGPEVFSIQVHMHPLLAQYLKLYTSPAWLNWMKVVLRRAEPFLGYIASRIAYYRLPPELLYLPIAESSYDPYAVSRAGAAGLWQLMTQTAASQHLTINKWNDQRFDFWKATDASLRTLMANYEALKNWPLALAAYDAGLGFMERLVAATGIHDFWTLAADGYLPHETVDYVPRFFAIAAICSYPGRYGLPVSWSRPLEWARVRLDGTVDLHLLADEAGVNRHLLMAGNAGLRYGVTPPQSGASYLAIPKADSKSVSKALDASKYDLMRFYIYVIRSGDTLDRLAEYYGVPVSMILSYNPGVTSDNVKVGTQLLIPAIKNVPPYGRPAPIRPVSNQKAQGATTPPLIAARATPLAGAAAASAGVTSAPAAIPIALPLPPVVSPSIPRPARPNDAVPRMGAPPVTLPTLDFPTQSRAPRARVRSANQPTNSYIVRSGDTLWSIAKRFGATATQLAAINGLNESSLILPGLVLRLPPG